MQESASKEPVICKLAAREVEEEVKLRPTICRPVYLDVGHPCGSNDQILFTVGHLRVS
jgi:hypothetical protein